MVRKRPSGSFADHLRALRAAAGLSVAALAEHAGVSRTQLHDLEAGRRQPSLRLAAKLLRALGVSLAVFDDLGT